ENTVASLISVIYQDINQPQDDQYFLDRTILSAHNDDVDDLNALILQTFPGHEQVHHSSNSMV
ncbi:hypothetical protein PAXINDRAFT_41746, partial [Paxillus involutus ATCC 200175]